MYQRCPFCDRLFEIGETEYRPMEHHIRASHGESDDGAAARSSTASSVAPL